MKSFLFALSLLSATTRVMWADWRDLAGFPQLQAELGAALPNGSGIPVMMSEATLASPELPPLYLPEATAGSLPFPGTGVLSGKLITPHSGASGASGHASAVAGYFCGTTQSVSPGVTNLHVWWADEFAGEVFYGAPIPVFVGSVQNHSWVGGDTDEKVNVEFLRRFDFMLDRDGVVATTPMNNGGAMAKFLANAYHGISTGLRNGGHPQTHSNTEANGRMKPDVVVHESVTSLAGPATASVATLLLDAIRPAFPAADDPRVVKAIMLSAASKQNLLGWSRVSSSRPYDEVHGAGELNVLNAYHILSSDRQTPSEEQRCGWRGWDFRQSQTTEPRRYFFRLLPGQWGATVAATLTWHRTVSADFTTASLANLNLHLRQATGFTPGVLVDESVSGIDNVEHLFLRNLPPGEYVLEVSAAAADVDYGLAWEVQLGTGPQLVAQRDGATVNLMLSQLDPLKSYTLQGSTDLQEWQLLTTIRTADSTPATSAHWQEINPATQKFYRLSWTP
jgi:hypothetical protein